MDKPSQIADQTANKRNKKQWMPPTVEVIGADIIRSGAPFFNYNEGSLRAKGSSHDVTKYFYS